MPRRILQAIRKLKPWKPTRPLPSYKEPTAETWSDVAAQYDQVNRTDLDDPEIQLEEPVWGELVE